MDHKEVYNKLHEIGFTSTEIDHLQRLRTDYIDRRSDELSTDYRRLEFIRWLVSTGRLTDQDKAA